jgi:hypothetical protein
MPVIPPDLALVAWIFVSFALTLLLPGYKAFTWSFLGAMFFLPSNLPIEHQIQGLPILARDSVITYGMLPATLVIHLKHFNRWKGYDVFLAATAVLAAVSSWVNGLPLYDSLSEGFSFLVQFILIVYLVRVHIRSRAHVKYLLKGLYWVSVIYVPLLVWEWRMSPQTHTLVYGYFPHSFLQMSRGSFFRPLGFFPHALNVAYLYALVLVITHAFVKNGEPGFRGWSLVPPIIALACSMSLGPIVFVVITLGLARLLAERRIRFAFTLIPVVLLGLFLTLAENQGNFSLLVDAARLVSSERAASLQYRVDAFELYIANILQKPVFGYGGWGAGRIAGVATDSALLVYLITYGFAWVGCLYFWFFRMLEDLRRRVNRTVFTRYDFVGLDLFVILLVSIVSDFFLSGTNSFVVVVCAAYRGNLRPAPDAEDLP